MDKRNQAVFYRQILDETNQLIQVSDLDTFTMQYANMPARVFAGQEQRNFEGEKCYHYMMGLDEQCPFCPMRQMDDKTYTSMTEIDNGVQVFNVKTIKIEWEGKPAFVEYATDITTIKRAKEIFEGQMQMLLQSIPEAQGIFHLNLTKNEWISSNGTSRNVDKLKNEDSAESFIDNLAKFIPDELTRTEFLNDFHCGKLKESYYLGHNEISKEVQSYYDDGSIRWARITARMIMNPNTGDLECIIYGMDINEEKKIRSKIEVTEREKAEIIEQSKRDMLTGVYSKKAFEHLGQSYINICNQKFAVIFMDLDHFKDVNDTLGHLMGDRAIVDIAELLQKIFSNKDVISRFGGDEFCILMKDIEEHELLERLDVVLQTLRRSYSDDNKEVAITTSIGAVYCRRSQTDMISIIREADMALYQAKRDGRDQFCLKYL